MNDSIFTPLTPQQNNTLFTMLGNAADTSNRLSRFLASEQLAYITARGETPAFRQQMNMADELNDIRGELNRLYGVV